MRFQNLGLLVLFLGRVFAEVPDPEKGLIQIGRAQSENSISSCLLRYC